MCVIAITTVFNVFNTCVPVPLPTTIVVSYADFNVYHHNK